MSLLPIVTTVEPLSGPSSGDNDVNCGTSNTMKSVDASVTDVLATTVKVSDPAGAVASRGLGHLSSWEDSICAVVAVIMGSPSVALSFENSQVYSVEAAKPTPIMDIAEGCCAYADEGVTDVTVALATTLYGTDAMEVASPGMALQATTANGYVPTASDGGAAQPALTSSKDIAGCSVVPNRQHRLSYAKEVPVTVILSGLFTIPVVGAMLTIVGVEIIVKVPI
jgi:hypothetical protein